MTDKPPDFQLHFNFLPHGKLSPHLMTIFFVVIASAKNPRTMGFETLLFPLIFVSLWMVIGYVVARSGWSSFASRYASRLIPNGVGYRSPHATLGDSFSRYSNAITLVPTDSGIHFSVLFLFRAFHPPFLLPWSSLRRVERLDGIFIRGYLLHIQDSAGSMRIRVKDSFRTALERFAPQLLPNESDTPGKAGGL
jgi:hypothetical protein